MGTHAHPPLEAELTDGAGRAGAAQPGHGGGVGLHGAGGRGPQGRRRGGWRPDGERQARWPQGPHCWP